MRPDILIFAVGNPSRGDDALGPVLMERLSAWLESHPERQRFELLEDFQLQVEHALDLEERSLALFIDAGAGTPAPFRFQAINPAPDFTHTSHALGPETVLHVYQRLQGKAPPPVFVLCIRGEAFELGEALSAGAQGYLELAWKHLQQLCTAPTPAAWGLLSA